MLRCPLNESSGAIHTPALNEEDLCRAVLSSVVSELRRGVRS